MTQREKLLARLLLTLAIYIAWDEQLKAELKTIRTYIQVTPFDDEEKAAA